MNTNNLSYMCRIDVKRRLCWTQGLWEQRLREKELKEMLSVLLNSAQKLLLVSVHCPYNPLLLGDTAEGLCTMQYICLTVLLIYF